MHTSEFFRNVLAPAPHSHGEPKFLGLIHFTSGSAWGALLTIFLIGGALAAAIITRVRGNADFGSE